MKKSIRNITENKLYIIGIFLFLLVIMSSCEGITRRLEGWKDLYLYNCSSDAITIKTSLNGLERGMLGFFKTGPYQSEPLDTITLNDRIYYYKWLFKTNNFKETRDSLSITLEPENGMRIIHLEWLISPTRFKERDLDIDNLRIITKSDTIVARNRKEILKLQFKRKCKDGINFKIIKYGGGRLVMYEKFRREI